MRHFMTPPQLNDEARNRGRENALTARRRRAQIKAELRAGELDVAQLLQERRDLAVSRLRVHEVLTSLPGIGPAKAAALEDAASVPGERRLGQLGSQQVQAITAALATRRAARSPRVVADPQLVVLSGPSGVGKSSVVAHIRENYPHVWFSISVTTRAPRAGERDGVDYHFICTEEFHRMRVAGELLELAQFSGHFYGTPVQPVRAQLQQGVHVMCEIELQGARQIRAVDPEALLVFLAPPSWEVLVARLTGRGTESAEVVSQRLDTARRELSAQDEFDVVIINERVSHAAGAVMAQLTG